MRCAGSRARSPRFIPACALPPGSAGSGASGDIADQADFLKKLSSRQSDLPVDPPIEAKTASTASEVELRLADPVSQFEAGEHRRRGEERFETFPGPTPRFDVAMVLFDDVVQVLVRAHAHIAPLQMLPSKPPLCGVTRHVTIERDGAQEALAVRVERLAKEGLGCCDAAVAAQQEVDGLAVLVNRSIQVLPLSPNADCSRTACRRGLRSAGVSGRLQQSYVHHSNRIAPRVSAAQMESPQSQCAPTST